MIKCKQNEKGQFYKGGGKHMLSYSREYRVWWDMLNRCHKPKTKRFKDYGGRGIVVCDKWHKFENFYADMGNRPSAEHSIDRINNNGNYEPSNCRWATRKEQYQNRRTNIFIDTAYGLMTLKEACKKYGLNASSIGVQSRKLGISHQDYFNERVLERGCW